MPCGVRKPNAFLVVSFALPLNPSTMPDEMVPRANGRAMCSGYSEKRPGYDRLARRRFQFVPLWNIAVFFV